VGLSSAEARTKGSKLGRGSEDGANAAARGPNAGSSKNRTDNLEWSVKQRNGNIKGKNSTIVGIDAIPIRLKLDMPDLQQRTV